VSDQDAKVLWGYYCLQGMKECHMSAEPFGNAIKVGMQGERFRWRVLQSEVCLSNKTDRDNRHVVAKLPGGSSK
jgi:hypothetical protein